MSPSITRHGVVVPVPVDPAGVAGPTPGQARGPRWRRVAKDLYVPTGTASTDLEQRIVEAVVGCGPTAAATGWAALAWSGARWFRGTGPDGQQPLPVPVALGDRRAVRARAGVEISEDWLFEGDVVLHDGLPITVPERSVSYEARRARTMTAAVTVVDMAAYDDLVDLGALAAYVRRLGSRPGVRRLREAVDLADENAWSPQEVRMRLRWRSVAPRAGLLCNPPIFDLDGRHLVTPDLLDPAAGVVGEYDGRIHLQESTFRRDLERDSLYRDLGLELATMMSTDGRDADAFGERLRRCYARARTGDVPALRPWTLEQPRWWTSTATVARRRALGQHERVIWLRHRAA